MNVCIFEVGTKEHIPQKCIILFNLFLQIFEKCFMESHKSRQDSTENDCFFFRAEYLERLLTNYHVRRQGDVTEKDFF
jgi:hypothetical protein